MSHDDKEHPRRKEVPALLARLVALVETEWDEQPSGEGLLCGKDAVIDFLHSDGCEAAMLAALLPSPRSAIAPITTWGAIDLVAQMMEDQHYPTLAQDVRHFKNYIDEKELNAAPQVSAASREFGDANKALSGLPSAGEGREVGPLPAGAAPSTEAKQPYLCKTLAACRGTPAYEEEKAALLNAEVELTEDGLPRFVRLDENYELCLFDGDEGISLRQTIDGDVAHIRYLNEYETRFVKASMRAALSHGKQQS